MDHLFRQCGEFAGGVDTDSASSFDLKQPKRKRRVLSELSLAVSDVMEKWVTLAKDTTYLEVNVGPLSVETDSDSFQFSLEQFPLCDRLGGVQHDHDQIGSSGDSNDLRVYNSQRHEELVGVRIYVLMILLRQFIAHPWRGHNVRST